MQSEGPAEGPVEKIKAKYCMLASMMDERMRRQWAASKAKAYGWGD
jgi:hypothetical protein